VNPAPANVAPAPPADNSVAGEEDPGAALDMVNEGAPETPVALATSRRILVVDDNADAADALACVLEIEGHKVTVARDGPSALVAAESSRPDIVLLDIGLPRMDGYEVARRLRGMSSTATAMIVALTGYGQPGDVAACLNAGFDLHLVKPVDLDALVQLVANAPRRSGP